MEPPVLRRADSQGRITLGKEWAGRRVTVKRLADGTIELRWVKEKDGDSIG